MAVYDILMNETIVRTCIQFVDISCLVSFLNLFETIRFVYNFWNSQYPCDVSSGRHGVASCVVALCQQECLHYINNYFNISSKRSRNYARTVILKTMLWPHSYTFRVNVVTSLLVKVTLFVCLPVWKQVTKFNPRVIYVLGATPVGWRKVIDPCVVGVEGVLSWRRHAGTRKKVCLRGCWLLWSM